MTDHELRMLWAQTTHACDNRGLLENGSVVGRYAEELTCECLGLQRVATNKKHYDAIKPDPSGRDYHKYQIKGRTGRLSKIQVNGLYDLEIKPFDYLVVVVFDKTNLCVCKAFMAEWQTVWDISRYSNRNGYGFRFSLENMEKLMDITCRFTKQKAAA